MNDLQYRDTTSTEKENSISEKEVLETSICTCGQEYDSYVVHYLFGRKFEHKFTQCSDCKKKEENDEFHRNQFRLKVNAARSNFERSSLINKKLLSATFEDYEPSNDQLKKAKAICERYAENFDINNPVSLLLIGNYGTGKSHLAVSTVKRVIEKHAYRGEFVTTPKLLTQLRSTYNRGSDETEEEVIEGYSKVSLLVMDDIGAEQTKANHDINEQSWGNSKIFEIIDNRIGRHTIFTTNFSVEELQQRIGGRNFSRLMENTHVVKMYGDDYRLRNFK